MTTITSPAERQSSHRAKKQSGKRPKQQPATVVAMQKIRQLIFNGDLVADSNHLETELAQRLGMSRTPVREATLMLQSQGLLEVQPRKGIRISAVNIEDIGDFYEVLIALECAAINGVANTKLTKAELASIKECVQRIDQTLSDDDRVAWYAADEAFHNELLRIGGNVKLQNIVNNINDRLRRLRTITLKMRPSPNHSHRDHKKLYKAIMKGDALLACTIHHEHRVEAKTMLVEVLQNAGLKRV